MEVKCSFEGYKMLTRGGERMRKLSRDEEKMWKQCAKERTQKAEQRRFQIELEN